MSPSVAFFHSFLVSSFLLSSSSPRTLPVSSSLFQMHDFFTFRCFSARFLFRFVNMTFLVTPLRHSKGRKCRVRNPLCLCCVSSWTNIFLLFSLSFPHSLILFFFPFSCPTVSFHRFSVFVLPHFLFLFFVSLFLVFRFSPWPFLMLLSPFFSLSLTC